MSSSFGKFPVTLPLTLLVGLLLLVSCWQKKITSIVGVKLNNEHRANQHKKSASFHLKDKQELGDV